MNRARREKLFAGSDNGADDRAQKNSSTTIDHA
jgi:hypothetical protein